MPATLKVTHKAIGAEVRRGTYDVVVDGERAGSVDMNHTIEIPVEPGRHTLRGMQQLLVEHPEPVAGVIEVAQLVHEPFGVQCPALAVAGDGRQRALPAVEPVRSEVPLCDLQVMAGYSLVVDGGDLLPGRELVDAVGR
jgi:hypothetical protein